LRRCDHPQRELVAVLSGDGQGSRPARHHRSRERPLAAPARRPEGLGADEPPIRLARQQLDHLGVQFCRFGIYRRFAEQTGIKRAGVCHSILLGVQGRYDIVS